LKRLIALTLTVIILPGFLCSCSANHSNNLSNDKGTLSKTTYQKISPEQAKNMMDEGKPYILLDVRTDEEYKEKRIDGAVLIPYDEIKDRAAIELPDKDVLILIYCRSGRRSAIAANEMIEMGYIHLYDFGGIIDWPFDTVNG
jgi:rhodanese-related sulfurtransferase